MAEYMFVSDAPQDFVCQVCMKILQDPHATECCGQHFCKVCLEKWLEKSQEKACPHCRDPDFAHILYKPLQRKINELKVYCTNRDEGCGEIMKLAEISSHLTDGCVFVKVDCLNKCGQAIMRKDMLYHVLNDCMKRIDLCSYCKHETTYDLMDVHFDVCEKMPVSCPRSCEESLVRGDLQDHEETCPNMMVKCPFYEVGCKKELLRKELDCHIEGSSTFHLLKFMASYNALKAAHDTLQDDHNTLQASHNALQADYETLKASNEALKKDYSTLKTETKQELHDLRLQIVKKLPPQTALDTPVHEPLPKFWTPWTPTTTVPPSSQLPLTDFPHKTTKGKHKRKIRQSD